MWQSFPRHKSDERSNKGSGFVSHSLFKKKNDTTWEQLITPRLQSGSTESPRRKETAAFMNDDKAAPVCRGGHKEAKRRLIFFYFIFFWKIRPQMKSRLWPIYFWPICLGCDRWKKKKKKHLYARLVSALNRSDSHWSRFFFLQVIKSSAVMLCRLCSRHPLVYISHTQHTRNERVAKANTDPSEV